jgi:hypothetical protein
MWRLGNTYPVHVSAPLREAARDGAVLVPQNSANLRL